MTKLPLGSIIRGQPCEHAYVIDKIKGDALAYAGAVEYRAGDRITEKEALALGSESANTVEVNRGLAI